MIEIKMPQLGLTMTEGTVTRWIKAEGETVRKGEPLFEVETDKLVNEVESEADGILRKILVREGDEVPVLTLLGIIADSNEEIIPEAPQSLSAPSSAPAAGNSPSGSSGISSDISVASGQVPGKRLRVSPLARRIARERGIDLSAVAGTGHGGRILSRDLPEIPHPPAKAVLPAAVANESERDKVRRVRMSAMRRTISKNMLHSYISAPVVHYNRSADATALTELKAALSESGRKISYTDILIKLVAGALMRFPYINASIDGDDILLHDYVHMGMAVALEDGLVVPVIREAHIKSISVISDEAKALAEKARAGSLSGPEMKGSTFTITNLGMFGIEHFTPIINQPESAILGVGAIIKTPEACDGEIVIKSKIMLSLTADHRVIDGAVAARFLQDVCDVIENPYKMLL